MFRVLLIGLPAVVRPKDDYLDDGHSFHLGLAYLGGMLRSEGYHVAILDCFAEDSRNLRPASPGDEGWNEYGLTDEAIVARVKDFSPDLIGISIPFSCQHYVAEKVGRALKLNFPHVPLAAGGNHVTALPDRIDRSIFDYLLLGEGEYSFLSLVNALRSGSEPKDIDGLYQGDKKCAAFIQDLDRLPFPAIDLLPLNKLWRGGKRWINMFATRGCNYDCVFCSIHTIMGYKIRRRSAENVIAEIKHWKKLYNIQEVYFEDDNLTTHVSWAKDLLRKIAACKFNIRFYVRNGIRADSIDKELLILMKKAGFHDFMISPETGSQRTLDEIIGKRMKLSDCERAVQLAKEVGLGVNAFFVVGFPEETWEDLEQTFQYALRLKEMGCVGFWVSSATPYPGTRFFEECLSRRIIDLETLDYRQLRTVDYLIQSPNFSSEELIQFRDKMMAALAPKKKTVIDKSAKALRLLFSDPQFFWMKTRYKLGI